MNDQKVDNQEYFDYLDSLRESGVVNMFGAGPYLERDFGLTRYQAKHIVLEWMKSFRKN
jgi:hypothetical protein